MSVPLFRNVKLHRILARHLPLLSSLIFYGALIAIPFISHLKEKTSVQEHSYLHGLIPDNVGNSGMEFMIDTIAALTKACDIDNNKVIEQSVGVEGFSKWIEDVPDDAPAVYKAIAAIVKEHNLRFDVAYNDFRYVFDSGLGVTGTSLLLRLKCARCSARGASFAVATVDTGSKREFTVDERGNVRKSYDSSRNSAKCSSSITGAAVAFTALREMSRYDNQLQDVLLLITDRNLPYAIGTRQFLDDYFGRSDFKWHSGLLHHGASIDLGYGRCGRYELNYEGMDGTVPNLDLVTSFLYESTAQNVDIEIPGLWERIGRMSTNSCPHLPHVPMLSRNIAAFSVTCAKKAESTDPNQTEKLLRTFLVTLRMHNNLETVLERSTNAYQMVDIGYYLPQGAYLALIPALLLGPTVELLYSAYTWDFHVLVASVCVFLFNAFMGPLLSYRYLVRAVGSDFDSFCPRNHSQVKIAISLLFFSSGVLLLVNLALVRVLPGRIFTIFDTERKVLDRQSLLLNLGYSVDGGNLFLKSLLRLTVLMDHLRRKTEDVLSVFSRSSDPDNVHSKRKRLSMKIGAFMQKFRSRNVDVVSSSEVTTSGPSISHSVVEGSITAAKHVLKRQLDDMGGTQFAFPTNRGFPEPNVIASVGTLFFAIVFLYGMMIFHWPLAIVLSLALVPSLRRVRIWNHVPRKCMIDVVVCGIYLVCILVLAVRRHLIRGLRREFVQRVYADGRFNALVFFLSPVYNLYVFIRKYAVAEISAALKGPFVAQKLFSLAQQHVLFGSGTFPLIWFCAIPLVFHIVLIHILVRLNKPSEKSQ